MKVDHPNLGDVVNTAYLPGIIKYVDTAEDLCSVEVDGVMYVSIPLFYHCTPDSILRSNGALEGASDAFEVNDQVIVQCTKNTSTSINAVRVVGFVSGLKPCLESCCLNRTGATKVEGAEWQSVNLANYIYYQQYPTPPNEYFSINCNADEIKISTPGFASGWVGFTLSFNYSIPLPGVPLNKHFLLEMLYEQSITGFGISYGGTLYSPYMQCNVVTPIWIASNPDEDNAFRYWLHRAVGSGGGFPPGFFTDCGTYVVPETCFCAVITPRVYGAINFQFSVIATGSGNIGNQVSMGPSFFRIAKFRWIEVNIGDINPGYQGELTAYGASCPYASMV